MFLTRPEAKTVLSSSQPKTIAGARRHVPTLFFNLRNTLFFSLVGLFLVVLLSLTIHDVVGATGADRILTQALSAAAPIQKTVLVMLPYQIDLPVNMISVQAIRKEFEGAADLKLNVYYEYMDLNRFPDPAYQQQLFNLYADKYKNKPVDLVIIITERMLNLWLAQRAEILPNTPIVFFDIPTEHLDALELPSDVTGVSGVMDYTKSAQWILDKLPTVNELVIVHGVGKADQEYIQPVQALQEKMRAHIKFTDLSNLPMSDIKQRVAVLPKSSVVIYAPMFEDAAGVKYLPYNALRELTAVSAVPVISGYDALIGAGSIGGYLYSYDHQARDAAQIGLRILRGEAVSAIPIVKNQSNQFIFDQLALQRFGIPLSALPPDSIIKNRQYSAWELYQAEIIGIATGFGTLLLLIAFLVVLSRRLYTARLALTDLNISLENQVLERTVDLNQTNQNLKMEIIERKQIEATLRDSENRLQKLFETMSEGVILIDPDGQIVQANSAAEHILGISRQEIQNHSYTAPEWGIIRPDGTPMPPDENPSSRAMLEKRPFMDTVMGVQRPDDSVFWVNVNAAPLINSAGELEGVVGTFADITERKKMDEELRASEARFRTFIENAPIAVALGRNGKLIYANPMYVNMHGFESTDELIGQPAFDRIAPQDHAKALDRSHRRNLGLPVEKQYEFVGLQKDGTEFQISASVTQINLADGLANIGFFQDITERKQMEEALRQSQAFLSKVIENSGVSIFAKDHNGHYELVNGKWEEDTGFTREFAIGKTDQDLFPCDLAEKFREIDLHVMEQGIAIETEEKVENTDETRFYVSIKLPLRDKNNIVTGICGISTDITERKRAAEQLLEANDRLEQRVFERTAELQTANDALEKASRLKNEFLATMSHELRTPLTGILGFSQVLQINSYGELNAKQAAAVQNIEKSGQHLLELINEILDFSKLQSGKLELNIAACSLTNICRASLQMINNLAEKKKQRLNFSISPNVITINADERRIRQILINLLGNAVKFTPDGGSINLTVNGIPEAQHVRIVVSDTGIGIKDDDAPRLFQPFIQLDTGLSRKYNGTGLGLSLVKNLVELHGGSVRVESIFGQGSRFIVILPWLDAKK